MDYEHGYYCVFYCSGSRAQSSCRHRAAEIYRSRLSMPSWRRKESIFVAIWRVDRRVETNNRICVVFDIFELSCVCAELSSLGRKNRTWEWEREKNKIGTETSCWSPLLLGVRRMFFLLFFLHLFNAVIKLNSPSSCFLCRVICVWETCDHTAVALLVCLSSLSLSPWSSCISIQVSARITKYIVFHSTRLMALIRGSLRHLTTMCC